MFKKVDIRKLKPKLLKKTSKGTGSGGDDEKSKIDNSSANNETDDIGDKEIITDESAPPPPQQQQQQLLGIEENENNTSSPDWTKEVDEEEENENENENEKEEDVHKILQDIEIPDFNLSVDFVDDDNNSNRDDHSIDYESRLQREEVFSKRYRPRKSEEKELQDISSRLGVSTSSIRLTTCSNTLHELLFGNRSIVLKKGPISFNDHNCELFLLTDGFISVYQNINIYNPLESKYDTCHFWSDIEYIKFANHGTLLIQMQTGESYNLIGVSDGEDMKSWLRVIEHIVTLHAIHDTTPNKSSSTSTTTTIKTDVLGWQYKLIHQSGYTAAVSGDFKLMGNPNPKILNQLDEYNQSSPLHYALQYEPCNAIIVDSLLRMGADPNLPDGEGRSAMYYAQRNELSDIEEILKDNGGKISKLAELELRGELFAGVDQAEKNTERRREIEQAVKDNKATEAAAKSQSTQSQMSQNMNAMIERGEKISEMDDKARQLNEEAQNYGKLASQLKDQMKDKKWYQF
jgi:hypothetical protein